MSPKGAMDAGGVGSTLTRNYVEAVVKAYEKWVWGQELSEQEVLEASGLLGTPVKRVEGFVQRFREVFGRLIEERCTELGDRKVCIYAWSRRAPKRYFPAALDAGGTVLLIREGGVVETLAWPLHRAYDIGARGVEVPRETPVMYTPRLDGWQVNLYYDPLLGRWVFSTRYVLHNMRFEAGRLVVEEYGKTINPLVGTAEKIASRLGLLARLDKFRGYTFTFMVIGEEPASALRRLPEPDEADNYRLVLISMRRPDGELVPPSEKLRDVAQVLGVDVLEPLTWRGKTLDNVITLVESSVDYPSVFAWFSGDTIHPPIYEVKSKLYEDYVAATYRLDGKSLIVLATSGSQQALEKARERLGDLVDTVSEKLRKMRKLLENLDPDSLANVLKDSALDPRSIADAARALKDGKIERALRILAASIVAGLAVGDTVALLDTLIEKLRQAPVKKRKASEEGGEEIPSALFG